MIDTKTDNFDPSIFEKGIIIPKKGVFELKKMADNNIDVSMTISVDDTFLYASINDNYFLSIRQIARPYPNYRNAIPKKTVRNFFVKKKFPSRGRKRNEDYVR